MPYIQLTTEAAALIASAESLCGQSDDCFGVGDGENAAYDKANRLARKALRKFEAAAKLTPYGRLRLPILMRALHVAGTLEDHEKVVKIVKQALACGPVVKYEDWETLRDHWDCSCWDDMPFPELPKHGLAVTGDAPGQLNFLIVNRPSNASTTTDVR